MAFPEGGRWACFFGPGTLVDTGIEVFRPPRLVDASTGIEAEDHGQLVIVNSETAINITVAAGRKAGFRTTLVQAGDGCGNVVAGEGVTLEPADMATGGKGSICILLAVADDDLMLVGQTGPAEPVEEGGEGEGGTEPPAGPPVNRDVPMVSGPDGIGTAKIGQTLNCTMGNWDVADSYTYAWQNDGAPNSATGETYTVIDTDLSHAITCVVTATNAAGSTEAPPSNAITITQEPVV